MLRMKTWGMGVAVGLLAGSSVAAIYPPPDYAEPVWAPQWFVDCNGPKSWADWSFPEAPAPPDMKAAPDNQGWNWEFDPAHPRMDPHVTLTGNAAWVAEFQGRVGVVGGESPVDFHLWMDNEERPGWIKQVLLRFDVWTTPSGFADFTASNIQLEYPGASVPAAPRRFEETPLPGGWRTVEVYFEIPQPTWEQINLTFSPLNFQDRLYLDDVMLLTQCVPEPGMAMLALLGGGLLMMIRRTG